MRAITVDPELKNAKPEDLRISDTELVPEINPKTEYLVKVHATAVNRADILQRQGKYPPPKGGTKIIGLECAGEVVEPGSLRPSGKRVMALLPGGGYAQYVKVLKGHTMPLVSEDQLYSEAASIPEVWCTAYQLLNLIARVQPGETVLIHAAASGVGTSMLQLCRAQGVKTIAVASNRIKLDFCKNQLGASHVINYRKTPNFGALVKGMTAGKGVNVIQDPVLGGHHFNENLDCLAMDSRWVIYGSMGGIKADNANLVKPLLKRSSILFSTLKSRTDDYKAELISKMFRFCQPRFASGEFKPIIDRDYPLSRVAEAHTYIESNTSIGKVILTNDLHLALVSEYI